jgi:hypothetical protein
MRAIGMGPKGQRTVHYWAEPEEVSVLVQHAVFAGCTLNEWLVRCMERGIADQLEIDRDAGFQPARKIGGRAQGSGR